MARPYRLQAEDCFYHITNRGDDRKPIYKSEKDYRKFLEYINRAKDKHKFYLYAYCLLTNHYHLLIETTLANISKIMHHINGSYTTYYNIKRNRSGHLFQGRYKSIVVDKDSYFLELSRYIHLNPVRVKIVDSPEKYRWSSYKAYLSRKDDNCIDKERVNKVLTINPTEYKSFVLNGIGKNPSFLNNVYAGCMLGSAKFIKDKLKELHNQIESKEISYKKSLTNIDPDMIINAVSKQYQRTPTYILTTKFRPLTEKKMAIYLIKKYTDLSNKQIGDIFDMQFSAVSKAALSIERLMAANKKVRKEAERIVSSFEG